MSVQPRIKLFEGLAEEAVRELLAAAQRRPVGPETVLFREGTPARSIHALETGFVRMAQTTAAGARVILRYLGPGETFGASALSPGGVYSGDAVAVTACTEMQWPAEMIRNLLAGEPQVGVNVVDEMEERLRDLEGRVREFSSEPVERRIAHAVVRLARKLGLMVGDMVEVPFPLARQDIADMTGTTLHTVSRTLGAWERQGLVRSGRQRVAVADLGRLAALAEARNAGEATPRRTHRPTARA
jgi:CRP-like cAMP-binding protein